MTPESIVELTRAALFLVLLLAAPIVIVAAVVGVLVGFVQAITSIQDQTLAMAIKLLVIGALLALLANWYGQTLHTFALRVFTQLARI